MSWFGLSVATALIYGLHSVYLKEFTPDVDRLVVTWGMFVFAVPLLAAVVWWNGLPSIAGRFWWAYAISVTANVIAWPLFVRAIQVSDLSLVMPLVAFTPVFILANEFLLLGTFPGAAGAGGILLIVVGAYVLNLEPDREGPLAPLRALGADEGARMMLAVAAIWSISATAEKITVTASSPSFYITMLSAGLVVGLYPVMHRSSETPLSTFGRHAAVLFGAGALFALMGIVQMHAVDTTPLVNYVIAIKRAGLLVSVVAGFLWFGEANVLYRSLGGAVMVAGVFLIRLA